MGLRSGTQWCPDCGFEQLVPEIHAPLAGRAPVLATGNPVAPAGGASMRIGLSAVLAVVAVITVTLIFGLLPDGDDDRRAAVGGDALIRATEPAVTPAGSAVDASDPTDEVDESTREAKREARRLRKARRAAATPTPSASPTPSATPTPTAAPTPSASPTPQAPRTPRPKPRTPKPSPTPPATPQPPAPAPTPTPPPAPQPTPTPTPPPAPPAPSPTPTPKPPTAEEIAAGLPSGMTCASLKRAGYGYDVAYAYWVRFGRNFWWDANRNGTICELDY